MTLIGNNYSVFVIVFWLFFGKHFIVFSSLFKFYSVCWKLVLKFVGDENDLQRLYVMVDYNILILL